MTCRQNVTKIKEMYSIYIVDEDVIFRRVVHQIAFLQIYIW